MAPIIVVLNLIYQYLNQALNFLSVIMVIFGILWIIFFPKFLDVIYKKRFVDMLGPINLESTALELSNEGLEAKSNSSEYKLPWNSVDDIIITKKHILIYLNINSGVSIPFNAFSSSLERESFTKYLYDHIQ
jgi:hypothetical protein